MLTWVSPWIKNQNQKQNQTKQTDKKKKKILGTFRNTWFLKQKKMKEGINIMETRARLLGRYDLFFPHPEGFPYILLIFQFILL